MSVYRVKITETLTMTVEIEAETESDAEQQVSDNWRNSEYILDADNFSSVKFEITREGVLAGEVEITWDKYLQYLVEWPESHREPEHSGMSPAGFDEWLANEYQEE